MTRRLIKNAFLVVLRETQFVVTTLTALTVLHLRTSHSIYFCLGALSSAFLAKFLKLFIRQPRPTSTQKKTYGMPSTHSSSIAFFGTYIPLCCVFLPLHPRLPFLGTVSDPLIKLGIGLSVMLGAGSVCWSRVRLGYHTPKQVIAGASLGSLVAVAAFAMWIGLGAEGDERIWWRLGLRDAGRRLDGVIDYVWDTLWEAWDERSFQKLGKVAGEGLDWATTEFSLRGGGSTTGGESLSDVLAGGPNERMAIAAEL